MKLVYNKTIERNKNDMSFVGLLKCKEGIVAFGDSKSSLNDGNGTLYEEQGRITRKVFKNDKFIFVTFGSNKYIINNKEDNLENLLDRELLNGTSDAKSYFENLYNKLGETFKTWPKEIYRFIYGEKENNEYFLYSIIINNEGIIYEDILKTTNCIHNTTPMCPSSIKINQYVAINLLKDNARTLVETVITLGNCFLEYNPVGSPILVEEFQ